MSHLAIIDIGSTSVGGAFLETPKNKKLTTDPELCSRLIASVRNEINFQENVDLPHYLETITAALKKTLADLTASKHGAPSEVVCFLSAPFYASQTQTIVKKETVPFTITEKLVGGLVDQQVRQFKEGQSQLFAGGESDHEVLESLTMQLKVNGYVLENPYRQPGQELIITHYLGIAASSILSRFRETIASAWHHREISFHSFAHTFYKGLTTVLPDQKNFLVLDICGEITELSLVWQGLLWETISFPLGSNWLVRNAATALGTTTSEVLSALKMNQDNTHHDTAAEKLSGVMEKAKTEWLTAFRQALGKVLRNCLLPNNLFVLANPTTLEVFRAWLANEQFEALTISNKKFQVRLLNEDTFAPLCVHETTKVHDFVLMVEALYCDILKTK